MIRYLPIALVALAAPLAGQVHEDFEAQTLIRDAVDVPVQEAVETRVSLASVRFELLSHASRLELNLFDDVSPIAVLDRMEPAYGGGFIWFGRIEGDPNGSAIISVMHDAVAASIRTNDMLYRIEYAGGGLHRIVEINEWNFRSCGTTEQHSIGAPSGTPVPETPGPQSPNGGGRINGSGGNPEIDVIVAYSPQARQSSGGQNGILSLVNLAVFETNDAYDNSQVGQRLRLIYAAETAQAESGDMGQDLGRVRNTNDGWYDEVHTWRDSYGGDLVAFIVNAGQYCGIAYLMTSESAGFQSNAFSVTARGCTTGYYSFGHELGHNMGSTHDRQNAGGGALPYSFGYRTPNNAYRTVMAYSPGSRIRYFSNPNVSYNGNALGIAHPDPNSAENWRSLNETSDTVAAWRNSGPPPPPPPPLTPVMNIFNLEAGQVALWSLNQCTPSSNVIMALSLAGPGPVASPFGPVDLSPPIRQWRVSSNPTGFAEMYIQVPANASGASVWFQGADLASGLLSNSLVEVIQ